MFGAGKRKHEARKKTALLIVELVQQFLKEGELDRNVSLDSPLSQAGLGLDSVACLELLAEIERRCEARIPERYWGEVPKMTLGDLVDLVVRWS